MKVQMITCTCALACIDVCALSSCIVRNTLFSREAIEPRGRETPSYTGQVAKNMTMKGYALLGLLAKFQVLRQCLSCTATTANQTHPTQADAGQHHTPLKLVREQRPLMHAALCATLLRSLLVPRHTGT